MSEELKPCPMCGGRAYYKNTIEFTSVRCRSCQLETKLHNDQEGALCAWNRRVNQFVDADKKVPQDYVIVPLEPTEGMRGAGSDASGGKDEVRPSVAAIIYKAMIQSAQKEGV